MEKEEEDILETIKERRSVKEYKPKSVSWELLSKIVDAGRYAPSSGNLQNWKFIVILDHNKRKEIAEASMQQYWMMSAPVHIIVCANSEKAKKYYYERGEDLYTKQNCAAAVQNMLLEATSLGLGTCWVGAFKEEMINDIIDAEEGISPQAIITIGYPKEDTEEPPKFSINETTFFNSWGNRESNPSELIENYSQIWKKLREKGKSMYNELKDNDNKS